MLHKMAEKTHDLMMKNTLNCGTRRCSFVKSKSYADHHQLLHLCPCIFSVKFKDALIAPEWRDHLCKKLEDLIRHADCDPFAIGGTDDHLHLYFDAHPNYSIDELLLRWQRETTAWINEHGLTDIPFEWQDGYVTFTSGKEQHNETIDYISRQQQLHQRVAFLDEYRDLLKENAIDFEEDGLPHLPI